MGLFIATGCGARVSLPGEGSGHASDGDDGAGAGGCEAGGSIPLPAAEVTSPTSGAFVDGFLHLAARLGGEERYLVIAIDHGAGYVVATPDELVGPANLAPAGPGRHARLRVTDGAAWVDVLDTSAAASPALERSFPVAGDVPPALDRAFSVVGDRLLACVRAQGDAEAKLVGLDVNDDSGQQTLAEAGFFQPCGDSSPETYALASGATWIAWRDGGYLDIYDVGAAPIDEIADYNYSPDGVHAYGSVVSAATDGVHIVFDIEHESRFFLYTLGSGKPTITHAWLDLAGPKKLLGVVDGTAYLANAEGVRAFDVGTIPPDPPTDDWPPPRLDDHADVALGEGLATLVASSSEWLVIADAAGVVYLVPTHPSGAVAPMKLYLGEPPPPAEGCE